ncbi:MAG TPA: isochorismate synthase, partial [Planctomycetes bacterium]|nr:isochorismate synthase [Planctomycetota bacterium]
MRGNDVDHPQANLQIRQGAYLPHWTLTQGGVYAVTFRLGDSLPKAVLERLRHERAALEADVVALNGILAKQEEQRLARLCSEKI